MTWILLTDEEYKGITNPFFKLVKAANRGEGYVDLDEVGRLLRKFTKAQKKHLKRRKKALGY